MIQVEIIGHLGGDAQTTVIAEKPAVTFSIATTVGRGQTQTTLWFDAMKYIPVDSKLPEYLKKGTQVFIRGNYKDSIYTGRDNIARISRNVFVSELELLGGGEVQTTQRPDNYPRQQVNNTPIPTTPGEGEGSDLPF